MDEKQITERITRLHKQAMTLDLFQNEVFEIMETSLLNKNGLCETLGMRVTYTKDNLNYTPLQFWDSDSNTVWSIITKFPVNPFIKKEGLSWFMIYHFVDGEIVGAKELGKSEYDTFREKMPKPIWSRWKE